MTGIHRRARTAHWITPLNCIGQKHVAPCPAEAGQGRRGKPSRSQTSLSHARSLAIHGDRIRNRAGPPVLRAQVHARHPTRTVTLKQQGNDVLVQASMASQVTAVTPMGPARSGGSMIPSTGPGQQGFVAGGRV